MALVRSFYPRTSILNFGTPLVVARSASKCSNHLYVVAIPGPRQKSKTPPDCVITRINSRTFCDAPLFRFLGVVTCRFLYNVRFFFQCLASATSAPCGVSRFLDIHVIVLPLRTIYSALQNDRPLFKKIVLFLFIYTTVHFDR